MNSIIIPETHTVANSVITPITTSTITGVIGIEKKNENKKKCSVCKIKLGLTGGINCRCGELFCASHIAGDCHGCSFNYHTFAQSTLSKQLIISDLISTGRLEKL